MLAFLAGAGFSFWAAQLPLAKDLFDFQIEPFGVREPKRLARVRQLKEAWDVTNPSEPAEVFIHYALHHSNDSSRSIQWYIVRRLSEPYLWYERHAFRWRRHVLMIDERRALERPGILRARDFITPLFEFGLNGLITTNYDLIIEYALGTKHFNYGSLGEILTGRGPYPVSQWRNPVRLTGRTPLAKVHGSISWDLQNRYTDGRRGLTGDALIVAPAPDKTNPAELTDEWDLAAQILRQASSFIVFGFGFNQYDTALLSHLSENGKTLTRVLLIDVAPKIEIASDLWPSADVQSAEPPPEGSENLNSWLRSLQED